MQKTMQNHAAVFRDGPTLEEGVKKMRDLNKELDDLKVLFSISISYSFYRCRGKKTHIKATLGIERLCEHCEN
jgi:hypothetical protein